MITRVAGNRSVMICVAAILPIPGVRSFTESIVDTTARMVPGRTPMASATITIAKCHQLFEGIPLGVPGPYGDADDECEQRDGVA